MGAGRIGIAAVVLTIASAATYFLIAYKLPRGALFLIGVALFVISLALLYRGVPESEYRKGLGLLKK